MRPSRRRGWQSLIKDIQRYLAGERIDFSGVAVDLAGVDPFRRRLYEAMRAIGFGSTTTYGELARMLGLMEPQAAQEVGQAMGRNPVPIVIPCHRVLAAGKKLGGFSAHGGVGDERAIAGARRRAARRRRAAAAGALITASPA